MVLIERLVPATGCLAAYLLHTPPLKTRICLRPVKNGCCAAYIKHKHQLRAPYAQLRLATGTARSMHVRSSFQAHMEFAGTQASPQGG